MDYYTNGHTKSSRWLGATLGGLFGVIAIGAALAIVALVRTPGGATAAVAANPPGAQVAAPAVASPTATQPAAAAPAVAAATPASEEHLLAAHGSTRAAKHAKSHRTHKRVAAASKRSTGNSDGHTRRILAKHDSKEKRKAKNDLDRLLGL